MSPGPRSRRLARAWWLAGAIAACVHAGPGHAILTRPDRDDDEYVELATRYPAVVGLGAAQGVGVLVGTRWILTAAKPASSLKANDRIAIAGTGHEVQAIFVHPDWKGGAGPDLALVMLRRPVESPDPAFVYRDASESGMTVRIVGTGGTGRMGSAAGNADGKTRAAINTVDGVTATTLRLRLKAADEASDLQGALAPGDAGAPAFVEVGGRIFVAGIASRTEPAKPGAAAGSVGDWEVYTRVSAFAAWIERTAGEAIAAESAAALGDTESR